VAKKSLLLVDSDARSLRVLEVSLKKAGFTVDTASSAADALQTALKSPPHLVITETQLPDSDGFELCRRLKGDGRTSRAAIVFLSSDGRAEAKVKGINSGADDYLAKPVMVMEIVTRVRALIERRETEAIARRERPGNLSGTLANMAVVDILQLMESGQKSGIVHLSSDAARSGGIVPQGEQRATMYFREGRVVDAHVGKLTGANAVYRMLMWNDGVFEIEFKALSREDSVHISTQVLLLEGMRRIDEWSRLESTLPPMTTRFSVDFNALGARYEAVPDPMKPVLHLFDGKRTIFDVVNEACLDDITVLTTIAELHRQGVLYHGDRTTTSHAAAPQAGSAVEAWLSGAHAPAHSRPSIPAMSSAPPAGSMLEALGSALGRAVIPSPHTPSEIMGASRASGIPDGTTNAPIPLTMPVRERTPEPEPIQDDQILLSRHTVPANQAVLLTQPSAAAASGPAKAQPIPLVVPSTRSVPKLRVQRVSSVVAKLSDIRAGAQFESPATDDDGSPIKSELSSSAGTPRDQDPTLTDFPPARDTLASLRAGITSSAAIAPTNGNGNANGGSGSAVPASVAPSTGAHPASAWPVTSASLHASEEAVRAPVRAPALIVAQSAPAGPASPSMTPPATAVPWGSLPARPQASLTDATMSVHSTAAPAPHAAPAATPAPRAPVGTTSGLHDAFFESGERSIRDSGLWDSHMASSGNRWKGPLLVMGCVLAVVGVAASLKFGSQTKLKAPEPPRRSAKNPKAGWPRADESAIKIGGNEGEAAAVAQAQAQTAQPAASAAPPAIGAQPLKGPQPAAALQAGKPGNAAEPANAAQPPPGTQPAAAAHPAGAQPAAERKPANAETAKPVASVPNEGAKAALTQAETLLRSDKLKDAEKQFRAILQGDPNIAEAHSGLAMALYGLEKDAAAGQEARKALALSANSARAYLVLGLIASNKQDIAAAKKAYKRYLELEPNGEYAEEVRRFMKAQQ
jgi:CheY-like chemotaxis protein/Flp pilus assembly protein TadD